MRVINTEKPVLIYKIEGKKILQSVDNINWEPVMFYGGEVTRKKGYRGRTKYIGGQKRNMCV